VADILLFDISMHGDDEAGLKLASQARELFPQAVIVMFSQFDDADTILRFVEVGADSFISKKTPLKDLSKELIQAYTVSVRKRPGSSDPYLHLLKGLCAGNSLCEIAARIPRIIQSAVRSVHLFGETGTGKEVVADLFDRFVSNEKAGTPFIRLNCGALSPTLLESELFGHKKGSFTGALADKIGLLEAADQGWIFLDEVALLSQAAQTALLRVVENQEITRLGETKVRKISVRVISACNEDLKLKVEAGEFRRDLWQRLTELNVELLPLRKRPEEIPELVKFFATRMGPLPYEVSSAALEILKRSDWSEGNVRELRNCLRAMTEYSESNYLGPNAIPSKVFEGILNKKKLVGVALSLERRSTDAKLPQNVHDHGLSWVQEMGPKLLEKGLNYVELEKLVFASFIAAFLKSGKSKISLREIEQITGLSRMTVSRRMKEVLCSESKIFFSEESLSYFKGVDK
jgi:DNA-binding NtrC family response regulator